MDNRKRPIATNLPQRGNKPAKTIWFVAFRGNPAVSGNWIESVMCGRGKALIKMTEQISVTLCYNDDFSGTTAKIAY